MRKKKLYWNKEEEKGSEKLGDNAEKGKGRKKKASEQVWEKEELKTH